MSETGINRTFHVLTSHLSLKKYTKFCFQNFYTCHRQASRSNWLDVNQQSLASSFATSGVRERLAVAKAAVNRWRTIVTSSEFWTVRYCWPIRHLPLLFRSNWTGPERFAMAGRRYQKELSGSDQMLIEKPAGKVVFYKYGR